MRFLPLLAGLVAVANAWTQPNYNKPPKGNPIRSPGLHDIVHKGNAYTITWDPTTPRDGTVTLVLLKGPSTNAVPQYPIAQKIPNHGSFKWTPKMNLEVSDPATPDQGYGILLVVDANRQYQYSTQFGVGPHKGGRSFDVEIKQQAEYSTEVVTGYTTYCSEPTTVPIGSTTYTVTKPTTISVSGPCTITHTLTPTTYSHYTPPSNGTTYTHPPSNHTMTHGTYKPTTHKPTHITYTPTHSTYVPPTYSSHSAPAPTDNAAAKMGMGLFAGAAGLMVAAAGL